MLSSLKILQSDSIMLQYVPVKEKVGEREVVELRNGKITDTLTSNDIQ